MIEIRPAIASDFEHVCNRKNHLTVRALTVVRDGEPIAIAGITIEKEQFVAFSDIKEGVEASPITIWRTARKLADMLRELKLPAAATTSKGKFLESLGFECVGDIENKNIYRI
jgi:hypothetical protein